MGMCLCLEEAWRIAWIERKSDPDREALVEPN